MHISNFQNPGLNQCEKCYYLVVTLASSAKKSLFDIICLSPVFHKQPGKMGGVRLKGIVFVIRNYCFC